MTDIDLEDLREELLQCRRCGICRNAVYEAKGFDGICPIWRNTSGFEPSFMRGKIQIALALLDGTLERTSENAEAIYQCTLCGNCTQICGAEFHPAHVLETVRAVLEDIPNESRDRIAQGIQDLDNPYSEHLAMKRAWTADLEFEVPSAGRTLYFAGCTADLRSQEIAMNTARILKAAGENFFVMENEPCCGSVLLRTGKYDDAETNASKVAKIIESTGAERIVVSCAGCMKTLKNDFSEKFDIEIPEIVHIVEYAAELIKEGRLNIKGYSEPVIVTYHDPCHIGRELDIYEAPREILKAIPGVVFVEMIPNRDAAICCGAGGGLRSYAPELSKKIAADRLSAVTRTGAKYLVSACPFCETNFKSGLDLVDSDIMTLDIVDLLASTKKE
ncbi:MAG: (Fe-S)-binding protein [Candidatus Thorarchaeota archaeon]